MTTVMKTIHVSEETHELLCSLKVHYRQTMDELIQVLCDEHIENLTEPLEMK